MSDDGSRTSEAPRTDGGATGTPGAGGTVADAAGADGAVASEGRAGGDPQGEAPQGGDESVDVPAEEYDAAETEPTNPLADAVGAPTGALPTAAVACLLGATIVGTTIVAAGSGMVFAGVLVVLAGLAAGGGVRLAWSARRAGGRQRSPGRSGARTAERAAGDGQVVNGQGAGGRGADGPEADGRGGDGPEADGRGGDGQGAGGEGADGTIGAAGSSGLHEVIASTADRAWLRLAGAGAAFVVAGPLWVAGVGTGVAAASGLVASSLHAVILAACGLALVGASAPEDLGWRGLTTATTASIFAATVPYLGSVLLGGGGALGTVIGWLGDVAWAVLLVFAWWNSPIGWGNALRFGTAMVTGLLLVGGLSLGVSVALARLDLARLAPRADREAVRHRLDGVVTLCRRVVLGVAAGIGLTVVLTALQLPSRLSPAAVEALLALVGASAFRVPLLAAFLFVWGGFLCVKLVVGISNVSDTDLVGWLPAGVGGGAVWLGVTALLVGLGPSLADGVDDGTGVPLTGLTLAGLLGEAGPVQIAAAAGTLSAAGALLTLLAFAAIVLLHVMGAFEGPSGAGALAVGGLATAAIAAGVRGALPLAVVGTMGAGLVAWDAGATGATMAAETEDGTVAHDPIVARVAATAGMVLLGAVVALGIVALVAGNLSPALQVPVLLGLVAALILGLWRLWALSSRTGTDEPVTIGSGTIRRLPVDHPSATSIVVGLLLWYVAGTLGGANAIGGFRIGAVAFLVVRVALGVLITRSSGESTADGSGADG